jgi:hypothetical protein
VKNYPLKWSVDPEKSQDRNLVTYLVSNILHDRFESVWPYYTRRPELLTIKQVIMGYMSETKFVAIDAHFSSPI